MSVALSQPLCMNGLKFRMQGRTNQWTVDCHHAVMIFIIDHTPLKMAFSSSQFYSRSAHSSRTLKEAKLKVDRFRQHEEPLRSTENPVGRLLEVCSGSCDPGLHFRVFCRQQQAIDFAKSCPIPKKVFAYELPSLGSQGQRRYLAESIFDFGRAYMCV